MAQKLFMRKFALLGYPLSHSFSKGYFTKKFKNENSNAEYVNFELSDISDIRNIIEKEINLIGFNVTIPYKEKVLQYVDYKDDAVQEIGAANTIKIIRNNSQIKLHAYNTDVIGFEKTLVNLLPDLCQTALVLGSGGASKAVCYVLNKLNINYKIITRNPISENQINYHRVSEKLIADNQLIINTTPLGMYPNIEKYPEIPYQYLTENHVLYDLIYNPETTKFLEFGINKNCKTCNGLEMLQIQAEESWKIWNQL